MASARHPTSPWPSPPEVRRYDLQEKALSDVLDLGDYIRDYDETLGDALVDALFDGFERLSDFPRSGSARSDLGPGVRCFHLNRQRVSIFYYAYPDEEDRVIIARVFRQERDVSPDDFGE